MVKPFNRTDRLKEFIKRELAVVIDRELKDPRLGLITLTHIEISKDLTQAKVYFTAFTDDETIIKQQEKTLNHATSYLHRHLKKVMQVRIIPELKFIFDESFQQSQQIERIISEINDENKKK